MTFRLHSHSAVLVAPIDVGIADIVDTAAVAAGIAVGQAGTAVVQFSVVDIPFAELRHKRCVVAEESRHMSFHH